MVILSMIFFLINEEYPISGFGASEYQIYEHMNSHGFKKKEYP